MLPIVKPFEQPNFFSRMIFVIIEALFGKSASVCCFNGSSMYSVLIDKKQRPVSIT